MIKTVNIIGAGNVAKYLFSSFENKIEVSSIFSRSMNSFGFEGASSILTNEFSQLKKVDLNIVAVTDDSISKVLLNLDKLTPVVHTSGSVGIEVFEGFERSGILYPLQSFSKESTPSHLDFPFLLEASVADFQKELQHLCKVTMNHNYVLADSRKRAKIHLAAVFVNNFSNHLAAESEQFLKLVGEDLTILKPLMEEGLSKIFSLGTEKSQTGPAKRGDKKVIEKQLNSIDCKDLQELYHIFTKMIQRKFNT